MGVRKKKTGVEIRGSGSYGKGATKEGRRREMHK